MFKEHFFQIHKWPKETKIRNLIIDFFILGEEKCMSLINRPMKSNLEDRLLPWVSPVLLKFSPLSQMPLSSLLCPKRFLQCPQHSYRPASVKPLDPVSTWQNSSPLPWAPAAVGPPAHVTSITGCYIPVCCPTGHHPFGVVGCWVRKGCVEGPWSWKES